MRNSPKHNVIIYKVPPYDFRVCERSLTDNSMKFHMCLNDCSGYMIMRFHDHSFSGNNAESDLKRRDTCFLCQKWRRQTESFYRYSHKTPIKVPYLRSAFRKLPSIYVFGCFHFGFEGGMWDLIVSVPDHCLSFYFI